MIIDLILYVFREELLENEYLDEYSTKLLPWDPAYLEEKDGDFLFKTIKKKEATT